MSVVQIIECTKCGFSESIPNSKRDMMPWEVWVNGCPKCGNKKVDVTVLFDKTGKVQDAKIGSSGAKQQ